MPESKTFKTIEEQLDILRTRGLKIPDEELAKKFLMQNNYYRTSGYSLTLRKNDVFSPSATFQNIIDIYQFDHEFRHILLKYLENIEVKIKSIYAYEFSKLYGPVDYLNTAVFTDSSKHIKILAKAEEQKRYRLRHEAYLKHFVNDLKQTIPLWAYVDLLTIADISILYSISDLTVQKRVAERFGMHMSINASLLESFMHRMTIVRNLCAHGGRLYNRIFEQKPCLNKQEKQLLIRLPNGEFDNYHLYGFILIMKRLLDAEDFSEMKTEIVAITKRYPFVRMKYYGFRDDWESVL